MLKNYLLIAWRSLLKNKTFSLINIFGLAVSLAACVLILLYVHSELTFDAYHEKADRIVRVTSIFETPEGTQRAVYSGQGVGPVMKEELPEVKEFVRVSGTIRERFYFKRNEELIREENIIVTDPQVFDVFTFHLIQGDQEDPLRELNTVVLDQSLANKYFESTSPIGKTIEINGQDYQVTAVMADLPSNVDLPIRALIRDGRPDRKDFLMIGFTTYVLLGEHVDRPAFEEKVKQFASKHYAESKEGGEMEGMSISLETQRLRDLHFTEGIQADTAKGNKAYPIIFALSGAMLFFLALFNYVNLTTIRTLERAREVGIRKTIGATRNQLIFQFVTEAWLIVSVSGLLAYTLVQVGLYPLNSILGKDFTFTDQVTFYLTVTALGSLALLVVASSVYPAILLSKRPTVDVIKGKLGVSPRRFSLRKVLVVLQFTISSVLMCGMVAIYLQLDFLHNKDVGFNQEGIMVLEMPRNRKLQTAGPALKHDLMNMAGVEKVSLADFGASPGSFMPQGNVTVLEGGREDEYWLNIIRVDEDYFDLMGMKMKSGEGFIANDGSSKLRGVVVNESFTRTAGVSDDPIGADLGSFLLDDGKDEITGVLEDYHYNSMHNPIDPIVMYWLGNTKPDEQFETDIVLIKSQTDMRGQVAEIWKKLFPSEPMEYHYLDKRMESLYKTEESAMSLFSYLTILSLAVAGLGLFGLSGFLIQLRTKEIGIRKVLGATVSSLLRLLTTEFVVLVLVAQVIAVPLAVWSVRAWLEGFAYRANVAWWQFGLALTFVVLIAVTTVAAESIRAARANPVDSLRTE
ncbi:MAG: FtsX-like permease family protein [Imperialibacter sp.]|uniref:ABC transporter permease n=1 Tax=Imperialibacter sp. TaxID=2038411 RepID=UPI0032EBEF5A